jgi:branched-chain amino acid transport system ATP-binding protein
MVLEVLNVSVEVKRGLLLLRDINLSIAKGEIVCIVGNNGAGKTTLLKTISGFFRPAKGDILLHGKSIIGFRPSAIARLGIAHVPEGRRVFSLEAVRDNLILGAYPRWWKEKRKVVSDSKEMLRKYPLVGRHSSHLAGTLSGGEQQFLAILRGVMMRPVVLMLDEPSLGLAPVAVKEAFRMIETCRKELDLSVILVEQMAYQALSIADRAYILERGVIVAQGTGKELLDSQSIRRSYLGSA